MDKGITNESAAKTGFGRGREESPVEERRVLIQGAVSLAVVFAVMVLAVWGPGSEESKWFLALDLIPMELILLLTSVAFFASLGRSMKKWLVDPIFRLLGKGT